MEQTQANAPAPAQAQTPAHPIHQEQADLASLTKWVSENPDNDPHHPENTSVPRAEDGAPVETEAETPAEEPAEAEFDEETPFFEIDYKTENGVEKRKLNAKELREGYLAKQDYHRNIQKVKAEQAEVAQKVQQAQLQAQQEYLQRLEQHKQLVLKTVAPELQSVDLNKLSMEDPSEAQRIFFKQMQVNQTLQAIESEQRAAATQHQEAMRVAQTQAIEKARQTLEADIPGWSADLYNNVLGTVAKDYGFKNEEVAPVVDARLIKVFHDAYKYRQLQQAKPEISKKVVTIPKVVKPGSAEKPNPAKEATDQSYDRLKKTGKGEDFMRWYLNKNNKGK
jgi:hypothetical protein